MAMVINTNVQSLNAQRNLNISQNDQKTAMDRLTSGKRINSAADDAAGLQIASGLTSQIRGLDQAVRNANDGISMVQTAEGALQESTNMLQRMRELAIQSASGTFTEGNRSSLNAEVTQLKAELTRIAETTTFNGLQILDGSLGSTSLQVGSEANQIIGVDFGKQSFAADKLGSGTGGDVVGTQMDLAATNLAIITGIAGSAAVLINNQSIGSLTGFAVLDGATSTGGLSDLVAQIETTVANMQVDTLVDAVASAEGTGIIQGSDILTVSVVDNEGLATSYQISGTSSLEDIASEIVRVSGGALQSSVNDAGRLTIESDTAAQVTLTTTTAAVAAATTGFVSGAGHQASMILTSTTGDDITIDLQASAVAEADTLADTLGLNERTAAGDIQGQLDASGVALEVGDVTINDVAIGATSDATVAAKVTAINLLSDQTGVVASAVASASGGTVSLKLDSVDGSEISIDYSEAKTAATLQVTMGGIRETNNSEAAGKTIENVDITTAAGAQKAIEVIDGALETINSARGEMGAVTNRLNFTVNNLSSVSQSASASRSRIEDADFAKESANLSRAQVLQQAGTAMLAQANAQPQQVLSLLQ
tara:strand:+ start:3159 stop:4946 length:1788 start_codon:yes stop_codon:yes gene_type:complete